ncbi:coiled-coil domain-containing protein [Wolbachia endosymbiont of Zygogramma bicolorata]|uniref:hypothetical protein n=1 Tax=Wolbachia endosymbiont of Zygogramma bicolorata TaxID=3134048 RepID=UPI003DA85F01
MLNTNNTVNYEINVKRKEKKYSWSTVFAWLYLKTIGRILPKKWNKWAENILSNKVTFQDTTMQTECVETTDKNIGADLKPEVAEKGSQSEVISKDGEVQTEENSEFTDESCFDTIVNDEFIDEEYDSMEEVSIEEDEELNEQLEDISQELELERSQNFLLEEENRELKFTITRLEKNHKELAEDAGKREEELVGVKEKDRKINSLTWLNEALEQDKKEMEAKNNEQQRTISNQEKRIREQDALIKSLIGKNKDISEAVKKDNEDLQAQVTKLKENLSVKEKESTEQLEKISSLQQKETELKQERKENVELKDRINALNSEKEEQLKAMKEERKMHEESQRELERKLESLGSQLRTAEVEKKSSENEVARLQEQVQILEGSKEWELAGIGDTLNKTSLSVMELLAQQLPLNNQEQQLQGKKVDLEDKLKILISQLNATEEEKQI